MLLLGIGRSQWLPRAPWLLLTPPWCLSLLRAATGPSAGMEKHQGKAPGYLSLPESHGRLQGHSQECPLPGTTVLTVTSPSPCAVHTSSRACQGCWAPQSYRVSWFASQGQGSGLLHMSGWLVPEAGDAPALTLSLWKRPMGPPCILGSCGGVDASGFGLLFHCSQPRRVVIQM